ncbi:endomembrane protein 70-domain containing protein [Nitzschia inconspicua]|uniref:Transmembrane 9 superfamily member n=1 Tax=Nitzschia inconspicua TaxID=303405 RepID=A0A9K3LA74_9STRA|nr:endomembrane protein 70-domain containing protein [Nitzschia inconspicua]
MTSSKTLLPIDYYRLPFCQPPNGPKKDNENLGEFLAGDRIESSPYLLKMKTEMYCEQVCIANLGKGEEIGMKPNRVVQAIRKEYHNNWIVDNVPAASKLEDDSSITTQYWQGFPVRFIGDDHISYINNHVNIEILYHPVDAPRDDTKKYRIVRFTVEPFSIRHDFEGIDYVEMAQDVDGFPLPQKWANIVKPILSCDPTVGDDKRGHTTWEMVNEIGREPQPASGQVLFTYDVHWEASDIKWTNRWDIFLSMDNAIPAKVHLLCIADSLVIVCVLSAIIITILVRNLRKDLIGYKRLAADEEHGSELEEKGWKAVHADVFRPPTYSPPLLSVACGTGAQLLCTTFWIIIFSFMGFLSPARRGALLLTGLMFYALMGPVNGYVTSRLYKTFEGKAWQNATLGTALGFPGICFISFFDLGFDCLGEWKH